MTTPRPSPHALWKEAGGDHERYVALMKQHGHLIPTTPRPDALTEESEAYMAEVYPDFLEPTQTLGVLRTRLRKRLATIERAARADAERELTALREALRRIAHSQESDLSVYARFAQEVATAALAKEESR